MAFLCETDANFRNCESNKQGTENRDFLFDHFLVCDLVLQSKQRSWVKVTSPKAQQTQQPSQKSGQGGQQGGPLRRKEPPVSAGGFYLLDRSPIEGDALFPSKILT